MMLFQSMSAPMLPLFCLEVEFKPQCFVEVVVKTHHRRDFDRRSDFLVGDTRRFCRSAVRAEAVFASVDCADRNRNQLFRLGIKSISCDITGVAVGMFTGDDGSEMLVPGNVMGALGGNLAAEKKTDADGGLLQNTWANLTEFSFAEWENNWVYSHVEANILLDANRYEAGYDGATLVLMRWGIPNQADLYIDNITFYDEDGKSIPLAYKPSGDAAGADSSKAE